MNKLIYLIAIAGIIVLQSCGKDGAPGATGPAGANGNANVSEITFSVAPGSWNGSLGVYYYTTNDPGIVDASTDIVEVSVSMDQIVYEAIPETNILSNGDNMFFAYENGKVSIDYTSNGNAPTQTIFFKVSTIPPQ
jgi:hypothetical protein